MSLNGLDSAEISQAFDAAITEAAGWFLLKYVSRDTVDLLGSGTTGVLEARPCMNAYQDKSPLFGLIMFRRRRVLIKYVPEGTSRLLQVRTAVHFQDVVDKCSPYDALLEITTVDGLSDTALASMFPLHAGSSSANNLGEIAEDGEETGPLEELRTSNGSPAPVKLGRKAALDRIAAYKRVNALVPKSSSSTLRKDDVILETPKEDELDMPVTPGEAHDTETAISPTTAEIPIGYQGDGSAALTPSILTQSPRSSLVQPGPEDIESPEERRSIERPLSPTSERESARSISDVGRPDSALLDDLSLYQFRPKIKLAPRPVQLAERKNVGQLPAALRRTNSSLPANVQARLRKPEDLESVERPATSASINEAASSSFEQHFPPQIPTTLDEIKNFPPRPQSSASFKSSRTSRSKTPLTLEKQRLMKAVEMRKRNLQRAQQAVATQVEADSVSSNVSLAAVTEGASEPSIQDAEADGPTIQDSTTGAGPAESEGHTRISLSNDSAKKSDSGIELNPEVSQDDGHPPNTLVDETKISSSLQDITDNSAGSENIDKLVMAEDLPRKDSAQVAKEPLDDTAKSESEIVAEKDVLGNEIGPMSPAASETPDPRSEQAMITPGADVAATRLSSSTEEPLAEVLDHERDDVADAVSLTKREISVQHKSPESSLPSSAGIGRTKFYEDSVSTPCSGPSDEGFLDDASVVSDVRNTWLSDATGQIDTSSSAESMALHESLQNQKRREIVAPLAIPATSSVPPNEPLSSTTITDDEDLEFFDDATVHEATPMAVMRSPATPVLSSRPSVIFKSPPLMNYTPNEAISSLNRSKTLPSTPNDDSRRLKTSERGMRPAARRIQTSTLPDDLVATSKKSQIGSGISERIAKLVESRSGPSSPLSSPHALPTPPASEAKNSGRSFADIKAGLQQIPSATKADPEVMKGRLRSMGMLNTTKQRQVPDPPSPSKKSHAYYTVTQDPNTRRQSVSVTARIVRPGTAFKDDDQKQDQQEQDVTQSDPSRAASVPIVTRDYDTNHSPTLPSSAVRDRSVGSTSRRSMESHSMESSRFKRFSFSRAKSHETTTRSESKTPSISSQQQRNGSPTRDYVPELPALPTQQKGNRTSRFLKRMSALSTATRKRNNRPDTAGSERGPLSPVSPSKGSKPLPAHPNSALEPALSPTMLDQPLPAPVKIGDLNVQFPSTGLWKRRFVEIDAQGSLLISVSDQGSAGFGSRHHQKIPLALYNLSPASKKTGPRAIGLSDVLAVYVPHVDDMELAHSVVLELKGDGGEVTFACEDGRGQRELLLLLQRYQHAWAAIAARG